MVCAPVVSWDYVISLVSWEVPQGVFKAWIEVEMSGQYLWNIIILANDASLPKGRIVQAPSLYIDIKIDSSLNPVFLGQIALHRL